MYFMLHELWKHPISERNYSVFNKKSFYFGGFYQNKIGLMWKKKTTPMFIITMSKLFIFLNLFFDIFFFSINVFKKVLWKVI